MTRIGRNDPCPCGSGKKYKQCCLRGDEEVARRRRLELSAPDRALDWLGRHHEEACSAALEKTFLLSHLGDAGFEKLQELPDEILDLVDLNAHEWLLVDGSIEIEGGPRRVMDLILGPGGALLDAIQRSFLERLAASPLRLYEVAEVERGKGVSFQDLLEPETDRIFVPDLSAAKNLEVGEIFGARLVPGEVWQLSGAGYQFPAELTAPLLTVMREDAASCEELHQDPAARAAAIRAKITETIIATWLDTLVGDTEEGDDELGREPLVVDRYHLEDLGAVVELLSSDPCFDGDPDIAGFWIPEGADERQRVTVTLDEDGLEAASAEAENLDRFRSWLGRHAAGAIAFTEREILSV